MPLLRLFMNDEYKSSLITIYALNKRISLDSWIGPKGLFNVFGYPGISKLNSKLYNKNELEFIEKEVLKINKKVEKKYKIRITGDDDCL